MRASVTCEYTARERDVHARACMHARLQVWLAQANTALEALTAQEQGRRQRAEGTGYRTKGGEGKAAKVGVHDACAHAAT